MGTVSRRQFIQAGVGTALAGHCIFGDGFAAGGRKPNIIFILADDLGYGDLGCYGQSKFSTPNIDRLAKEGILFRQHYSGSTVCAPSRCSLMTGLHMGHAYVRGNAAEGAGIPLRPDDLTVAEALQKAGYKTGLYGKWGLGVEGTLGHPNRQGFDEFFGYLNQQHAHAYYTDHLFRNETKVTLEKGQYSHDLIMEEALGFVRRNRANPFFLYLAVTIPHASMEVPEDSIAPFRGKYDETPFAPGQHYSAQPTPNAAFAGMVTRLDQGVGRLLKLLEEIAVDQDTIVFFSSDNGPHKEGGRSPEYFKSSGPLKGIKRDLYEGGIRVPLLARWPGKIKAGTVSEHASAFWDFLPTACDIAGTTKPKRLDGISMMPTLSGARQPTHDYLYWEFYEKGFQQAVREGKWKAVKLAPGKPSELYDLENDISESRNIADAHPDVVKRLDGIMRRARTESEHWKS